MPTIEVVDVGYYRQEKLKPLAFSIHSRSFTRLDRDADKREPTLQRSNRRFRSVVQSDEVRTLRLSLFGPRERRRLLQTFPVNPSQASLSKILIHVG
jgi:hypothetical protein